MTITIPEKYLDLLSWEKKAFAHLAIVLNDGSPHVTPVWFDYDGEHVILNSAVGRVKDKVLRRSGVAAVAISDPDNPYRHIQIRGKVVEVTEQDAREMIDHLSQKYTGNPYQWYEGEIRVTYRVLPQLISTMG